MLAPEKPPALSPADQASGQMFALALLIQCLPVLFGASLGYTSPTLADCTGGSNPSALNCELLLTLGQKSLFGAMPAFTALLASLAGVLGTVDALGRRPTMIAAAALFAISWVCVACTPVPGAGAEAAAWTTLGPLFVGRALSGLAIGVTCCVVNVYVSEIATVAWRGALGTLFQASNVAGFALAYLLGIFLHWRAMAVIIAGLAAVLAVLLAIAVPESPLWSLQRGRREAAARVLRRIRAPGTPVDPVLDAMDRTQAVARAPGTARLGLGTLLLSARKPLIAGVGLAVLQQLSGISVVMFYCGEVLARVFDKRTADVAALGLQVLNLALTVGTAPLMDRAGRRRLVFISGAGMALCSGALGGFYHVAGTPSALPSAAALVMIYAYVAMFAVGLGPVPWLIIGEIFPPAIKGACSSLCTAVNWGMALLVTETVADLRLAVGLDGVFWMYGALTVLGLGFTFFRVPETKGRSLEEIQAAFEGVRPHASPPCSPVQLPDDSELAELEQCDSRHALVVHGAGHSFGDDVPLNR